MAYNTKNVTRDGYLDIEDDDVWNQAFSESAGNLDFLNGTGSLVSYNKDKKKNSPEKPKSENNTEKYTDLKKIWSKNKGNLPQLAFDLSEKLDDDYAIRYFQFLVANGEKYGLTTDDAKAKNLIGALANRLGISSKEITGSAEDIEEKSSKGM